MVTDTILDTIKKFGGFASFSAIVQRTGLPPQVVVTAVNLLREQKKVEVQEQIVRLIEESKKTGCSFCNRMRRLLWDSKKQR